MVNVICMKWGKVYDATYVNRLQSMVRRNLKQSHRFVCFTDDPAGITPEVEVLPLPEIGFKAGPGRFWNKLGIFTRPLADLTGPVLWLDLDVVIVAELDCFFEFPGRFCIIKQYNDPDACLNGNSSVCRFEAGAHANVLEEFHRDPRAVDARFYSDQEFICATIRPLTFWPRDWCPSFKRQCLDPVPFCYFKTPRIPPGARIVVFHGHPKPSDAARGGFVRGGIKYCRATPWIDEHWR